MAQQFRVAIIGCGRGWNEEGRTGSGMAHLHARGYVASGRAQLIALADIVAENARAFAERHAPSAKLFTDYRRMLAEVRPDVVSICTWPRLHEEMTLAAISSGVRAVHCEKPMAPTWGEARRMHAAAMEAGCQLTFNHQRRFLGPFRAARRLLRAGALGQVTRLEAACDNIIDWGTHWLDMFFFLNEETPAAWVLGQVESREERAVFGLPLEDQAVCEVLFTNQVRGVLFTGYQRDIGCEVRVVGTEGILELHNPAPHLRVRGRGDGVWWAPQGAAMAEGLHGAEAVSRGIADLLAALDEGREPELGSNRALRATEIIFATYESSRRRGRVDLPLEPGDSAFLSMLAAGQIGPARTV